jgi:hypothetical protein
MWAEVEMGGIGDIEWPRDHRGHMEMGNPRHVIGRRIDSQLRPRRFFGRNRVPRSAQEVHK